MTKLIPVFALSIGVGYLLGGPRDALIGMICFALGFLFRRIC